VTGTRDYSITKLVIRVPFLRSASPARAVAFPSFSHVVMLPTDDFRLDLGRLALRWLLVTPVNSSLPFDWFAMSSQVFATSKHEPMVPFPLDISLSVSVYLRRRATLTSYAYSLAAPIRHRPPRYPTSFFSRTCSPRI